MKQLLDCILDALLDSAKILPFLFFAYLAMEYIEHKMGERAKREIERAGALGAWCDPAVWIFYGSIQFVCRTYYYNRYAAGSILVYLGRNASHFYIRICSGCDDGEDFRRKVSDRYGGRIFDRRCYAFADTW